MCDDCERYKAAACDAAGLRRAFYEAGELFNAVKSRVPFPEAYAAIWGAMYNAVRDHQAGLAVIKELADLRAEVAALMAAAR